MKSICLSLLLAAITAFAQPYQPQVIWDRSGETDSSAYGWAILPLGDQNDDGFADWAVYAEGNWGGQWGGTRHSYVEFFHGASSPDTLPYRVYRADTTQYLPLWFAVGVGDVNGDGYQDWEVRLVALEMPPTYTVFIFFGGPNSDSIPDVELHIPLGSWCYPLGDFNGDGFDDQYWSNNNASGRVYFGGSPMDTLPGWVLNDPPPGFFESVPSAMGDFNGDGASDFIFHNPNPPFNAAIFLGGTNADTLADYLWTTPDRAPIGGVRSLNGDPYDEFLFEGANVVDVYFGNSALQPVPSTAIHFSCTYALHAASAGDFNHDGYNDLLMWNDQCDGNMFGALDLHLGHPWLNPSPAFTIEGSWPDGLINIHTAVGLGDVNGDGIDDFAIGAWDDFAYLGWRGRCVIIAGDDSLIAAGHNTGPELPRELSIEAYPNPFNSEATIRLQSPPSAHLTTLTVYNVLGEEVREEVLPPFSGQYTYQFHAGDLPSGVYLAHVQSGDLQTTQKLMLLR